MKQEDMERNIQELRAAPGLKFPTQLLNAKIYQEPIDKAPLVPLEEDVRRAFAFLDEIIEKLPLTDLGCQHQVFDINHDWVRHVLRGSQSWHNGVSGSIVINTYRRLTPPDYQTPEHMKVVYMLFAAVELTVSWTVMPDDQYDMTRERHQTPAWFRTHPVSIVTDAMTLLAMSQRILMKLFPRDHPCFAEILERTLAFFQDSVTHYGYDATCWNKIGQHRYKELFDHCTRELESLSSNNPLSQESPITKSPVPFELLGVKAYDQHTAVRSKQYVQFCIDVGRMAACYTSVDVKITDDVVARAVDFITPFDDYQEYHSQGNIKYEDITSGSPEIFVSFLMDTVKEPGFPSEKRDHVMTILERNFGTCSISGAQAVADLYEEMGIPEKVRQHLYKLIDDLDQVAMQQAAAINFPMAIVFDMIMYICREDGTLEPDTIQGVHKLTGAQGYTSKGGAYTAPMDFLRRLVDYFRPSIESSHSGQSSDI
ncbi:hypothetical protein Aspvir_001627 [Aspergillus viridinutans]|uniref:Uncharacterized protein n=1 Tax=Aspergillus viridinutans TaxID=75553 RepID=A0A9P3BTU2_ASPVI|nr:uncharacterized protein Aspvir_001627 [Aspergillus viridinutans]GIJ99495.1 hypothetical protein Aspvir_001627 [Aspergillus viridinutans]